MFYWSLASQFYLILQSPDFVLVTCFENYKFEQPLLLIQSHPNHT
jgi:hypothetical protein